MSQYPPARQSKASLSREGRLRYVRSLQPSLGALEAFEAALLRLAVPSEPWVRKGREGHG